MNPRLEKLLRQRDLVREHLRWLEDEIEGARQASAPAAASPNTPQDHDESVRPAGRTEESDEGLLDPDVRSLQSEVRRGCLLYAAIAFGLFGAVVAVVFWVY